MKHYLGIDIGGTAVKLGIVDEAGAVLAKAEESVSFDGYRTPILTTVLKAAQAFLAAQSVPAESLAGIGVSATGQIDSRKGIVAGTCGNFPNYIGSPIKAALEQDFGLPVTVANDANCMTLGEVWVGGAQGYTDVIGVTLGTGVGGGILTGGRLLEGARGLGGELGHYRTHALDGVPCTCGAKGCWERYAATTALVRAAKEKDPAWTDGRAIFAAAEAGNPEVLALLDANRTDELYKLLLIALCNALSDPLPGMFEKISQTSELLFPDALLKAESVLGELAKLDADSWSDIQVIGWLYQYYISQRHDEVVDINGSAIPKADIPAATCLYTTDWVVRYMVENSLGRLWLEGHPESSHEVALLYGRNASGAGGGGAAGRSSPRLRRPSAGAADRAGSLHGFRAHSGLCL